MQYFIKVKFRRLLAVIGRCRAWIDYKIQKHYSTRFGRYYVLSTNHRESIYFALKRATKGRRQFKDRCLRAKRSPLSYVFLCISELTKGQTNMVCGPDLAHGPPFEKAWHNTSMHARWVVDSIFIHTWSPAWHDLIILQICEVTNMTKEQLPIVWETHVIVGDSHYCVT